MIDDQDGSSGLSEELLPSLDSSGTPPDLSGSEWSELDSWTQLPRWEETTTEVNGVKPPQGEITIVFSDITQAASSGKPIHA